MTVELTMEEQSILADVAAFMDLDAVWKEFTDFCGYNGLTAPIIDEYDAVVTKVTGQK